MHEIGQSYSSLSQIVATLFNRHWLIGCENLLCTLVLGNAFISLIKKYGCDLLGPIRILALKRVVLLIALFKGALFFTLGEKFTQKHQSLLKGSTHFPNIRAGIQFPDFRELVHMVPPSPWAIWRPAPLTAHLTDFLLTYAATCLIVRIYALSVAASKISQNIAKTSHKTQLDIETNIQGAASAIGYPGLSKTIVVITSDAMSITSPFVLGLKDPKIVIRKDVLELLIEKKWLGVVLRHELMHIVRKDHLTRWFQLWIEDVLSPTFMGRVVGKLAFSCEEQLCDCGAIKTAYDADTLAQAIVSISRNHPANLRHKASLTDSLVPSFLGFTGAYRKNDLLERLKHIASHTEFIVTPKPIHPKGMIVLQIVLLGFLGFCLILVLYSKIFFFWAH